MSETKPCVRGCTMPRQHATACEDNDTCHGCLPRPVWRSTSHLCEPCHLRLSSSLADVDPQHRLLLAAAVPSQQMQVRPQPKRKRPDYWPTESGAPRYFYLTGGDTHAPQEGEPVRIACHDTAQALADLLAEWVEWVCDRHDRRGPDPAMTAAEREGRARWSDPPPRFEVATSVRWLRANLEWLEQIEHVGDMMEELRQVMGQAHALCPWRLPAKRIPAIPCPECHVPALTQYGGQDTVTCTNVKCQTEIPQGRYLLWARIYEEEAG